MTGQNSEDICTLPGMMTALRSVLRVKTNGAFWSSPECKTWLNMTMGHTRRDGRAGMRRGGEAEEDDEEEEDEDGDECVDYEDGEETEG